MRAWTLHPGDQFPQLAGRRIAQNYTPGFPIELALKDIRLAEQAEGQQPPLTRAIEERLQRAVDAGHARDDVAAVAAVA